MKDLHEQRDRGSFLFPFQHYRMLNGDGNLFVPYHWHEEVEILYVIRGSVRLLADGREHFLKKGTLFFLNGETLHQLESADRNLEYYAYVFPMASLQFAGKDYCQTKYMRPLNERLLLFPERLPPGEPCYGEICREMEVIIRVNERKSSAYQLETKASLLKIFACLARENLLRSAANGRQDGGCQESRLLREIMTYLDLHSVEKVSLEMIAGEFHMAPKYFSRFFKKHFRKNFVDYLNCIRVEKACEQLLTTNKPVAQIACEAGFENSSYFAKRFRQLTGRTPLSYRKS